MTPKQKAFCDYYIASGNATEAAIKAGYSKNTARAIGAENLTKLDIKNYIAERAKLKENERIATAKDVLEFFSVVMNDNENSLKDRLRAAEDLGKILFIDSNKTDANKISVNISVEDCSHD